jgi:hypothetical protein
MRRHNGRIERSSKSGRTLHKPNKQTRHDVSQTFNAHWSSFNDTSGANERCKRESDEKEENKEHKKRVKGGRTGNQERADRPKVDAGRTEDEDFRREVSECDQVGEQGHVVDPVVAISKCLWVKEQT